MEEVIEEVKTGTVIIDKQPEFKAEVKNNASATYFILCENEKTFHGKDIFEYKICGVSLIDWVARACENKPVFLRVNAGDDIISLIRPYSKGTDYSVVLYANTPLVSKNHISDLLEYVSIKRMNVAKLKKGFVLSNEHIGTADEIFSVDTYDFSSNDFFEVNNLDDLDLAQKEIHGRLVRFHHKNGVVFEDSGSCFMDANVKLGQGVRVGAGAIITENSSVDDDCEIGQNVVIKNSIIGKGVKIGSGAIICGCVIKDNATIEDDVVIKCSVIGNSTYVGECTKIINSGVKDNTNIGEGSFINCARIAANVKVGMNCRVLGDISPAVILSGAVIQNNAEVVAESVGQDEVFEEKYSESLNTISHEVVPQPKTEQASDEQSTTAARDEAEDEVCEQPAIEKAQTASEDDLSDENSDEGMEEAGATEEQASDEYAYGEAEPYDFDYEDSVEAEDEESDNQSGLIFEEPADEEPIEEEPAEEEDFEYDEPLHETNVEEAESNEEVSDEPENEFDYDEPAYELDDNSCEEAEPEDYSAEPEQEDHSETEAFSEPESEDYDASENEEYQTFENDEYETSENEEYEEPESEDYAEPTEDLEYPEGDGEEYEAQDTDAQGYEISTDANEEYDGDVYAEDDGGEKLYSSEGNDLGAAEENGTDNLHYWDSYEGKDTFKEDNVHEEKESKPHYWQDEYNGLNSHEDDGQTKYVKPLYWQDEDDKD